ncbi:hypothetical protein [Marinifilum sp. D737]|uniref:hypothetical protein n=1 Tax=Marinifilum sp. D737 TaxID=2969628 RepID=UPI002272B2A4|nr:hypothetical protein [Marinifilum sp. D737]MCY1636389.1 hypothetical protein [Marinifilum sp. D737]
MKKYETPENSNKNCDHTTCKSDRLIDKEYENCRLPNIFDSEIDYPEGTVRNVDSLSFFERFLLYALLKASDHQDYEVYTYDNVKWHLSPNSFYIKDIVEFLINRELIEICNDNLKITNVEDKLLDQFEFRFVMDIELNGRELYMDLISFDFKNARIDDIKTLWQYLSIEECIGVIECHCKMESVVWTPADSDRKVIKEILMDYSVSQFYNVFHELLEKKKMKFKGEDVSRLWFFEDLVEDLASYFTVVRHTDFNVVNEMEFYGIISDFTNSCYDHVLGLGKEAFILSPYSHSLS